MEKKPLNPDYLFEVSWEVCNLVGGIYTVLSTKAKTLQQINKDKNVFIGPDLWKEKESPYFTEIQSLYKDWKKSAAEAGLQVRTGRWNIPGKPIVILVDYSSMYKYRNELFTNMWNWYGVDSLPAYGDYDESCIFAYTASLVIENFYQYIQGENFNVVAHFDEWTTGMGLLYIKHKLPAIATVFTTHATSMGRSIAGNNKPLYDYLPGYNGDQMAHELNMVSKHSLEKHAAHGAHCFTTVSDITARECAQLLERAPDIVTPNGFEENFVPKGIVYQEKRKQARERLLKLVGSLIGYKPDPEAFLIATSGRYEYKNKGIDLYIEAIRRLKETYMGKREIIAFVMVPAWSGEARGDLVSRMNSKKSFKTALPDPFITHALYNYDEDRIMAQIHGSGFLNQPKDKVKIIFIPSYLKGDDGILDLPYYDTLIGLDATAFPSYYEPWGYTPLESVAFGIPTVTTDLSGFGLWNCSIETCRIEKKGVAVLHRTDSDYNEVANELVTTIKELSVKTEAEMKNIHKAAVKTSKQALWKHFISYYERAYDQALKNVNKSDH
ncbi:glycosyltransferase [Coprobacter sp.]